MADPTLKRLTVKHYIANTNGVFEVRGDERILLDTRTATNLVADANLLYADFGATKEYWDVPTSLFVVDATPPTFPNPAVLEAWVAGIVTVPYYPSTEELLVLSDRSSKR